MDINDQLMRLSDPIIPDDFLVSYKHRTDKTSKAIYLLNTLFVNVRSKVLNKNVKSQLDLLGVEKNNLNISSYNQYFYNLHVVSEELVALQRTETNFKSNPHHKVIIASLPSIIEFVIAVVSPTSTYDKWVRDNCGLFEIKHQENSHKGYEWEKTLKEIGDHSKERLLETINYRDLTQDVYKEAFFRSKAFSIPLEKSFHFNQLQTSTMAMDRMADDRDQKPWYVLYVRRVLQHYNTNLQHITQFEQPIEDTSEYMDLDKNYKDWIYKVDEVKYLFSGAIDSQEDSGTKDEIKMFEGIFDISAEINALPPLKKLYQQYISNPQNLPSNKDNLKLDQAIRNLDQHKTEFLEFINKLNETFYASLKHKLSTLRTTENTRKFSTIVTIPNTLRDEFLRSHIDNRLSFFDLSGEHERVNQMEEAKDTLKRILRKLHGDKNHQNTVDSRVYNNVGNTVIQFFNTYFNNFKSFPVLYTMFLESIENKISSGIIGTKFHVATKPTEAQQYWYMHMQSFLSYIISSECSENFLKLMKNHESNQEKKNNTAGSDTNVDDPTVVTEEANNLNSTESTSSESYKTEKNHYTSTNCTSSSTSKPFRNSTKRNTTEKSNTSFMRDNVDKPTFEEFKTERHRKCKRTSGNSDKKKTPEATQATKDDYNKTSGTQKSAKYDTDCSSSQKTNSDSSAEKEKEVIEILSSDDDEKEDDDKEMQESSTYTNEEFFKILCFLYDFLNQTCIGQIGKTYLKCKKGNQKHYGTINFLEEISSLLDSEEKFNNFLQRINKDENETITGEYVYYWMKHVLQDTICIRKDDSLRQEYNEFDKIQKKENKTTKKKYKGKGINMARHWANLFYSFRQHLEEKKEFDNDRKFSPSCLSGMSIGCLPDKFFNQNQSKKIYCTVVNFNKLLLIHCNKNLVDEKVLREILDTDGTITKRKFKNINAPCGNKKKKKTTSNSASYTLRKSNNKKKNYCDENGSDDDDSKASSASSRSYSSSSSSSVQSVTPMKTKTDNYTNPNKKNQPKNSKEAKAPHPTTSNEKSDDNMSAENAEGTTGIHSGNFSNNENNFKDDNTSKPSVDFSGESSSSRVDDDQPTLLHSIQHKNEEGNKLLKCTTSSSIMPSVFCLMKKFYKVLVQLVDKEMKNNNYRKIMQITNDYFQPRYNLSKLGRNRGGQCKKMVTGNRNDMFWKLLEHLLHKNHKEPHLPKIEQNANFSTHISIGLHLHFAVSLYGIYKEDDSDGKLEAYIVGASPDYFVWLDKNKNNNCTKKWQVMYMGIIENTIKNKENEVQYLRQLWKEMFLKIKGKYINRCDCITLIGPTFPENKLESTNSIGFQHQSGPIKILDEFKDIEMIPGYKYAIESESKSKTEFNEYTFEFKDMECNAENNCVQVEVFDPEENFDLLLVKNNNILQMKLPFTESWINIGQVTDDTASESGFEWWKKAFGG